MNLVALFTASQRAARVMLAQGSGSIVNIASALGLVASAPTRQAAYCASKGAVVNLTRELAAQWAARGVRVNSLPPGWFRSEMTGEMFDNAKGMAFIERGTPIGRVGRPDELVIVWFPRGRRGDVLRRATALGPQAGEPFWSGW